MEILCVSPGSCMGEYVILAVRRRGTALQAAPSLMEMPGTSYPVTHRLCEAVVPSRHIPADGDEAFAGGDEASADGDVYSAFW